MSRGIPLLPRGRSYAFCEKYVRVDDGAISDSEDHVPDRY